MQNKSVTPYVLLHIGVNIRVVYRASVVVYFDVNTDTPHKTHCKTTVEVLIWPFESTHS